MSESTGSGPTGFEIRLARDDELRVVGETTVRGYAYDGFLRDADPYADRLRDAASRAADSELWVAVARPSERLLGSVTFCPLGSPHRELADDTEAEFRMLAVDPTARGLGVGRALVRQCVSRSRELGFVAVVLCSLPAMTTAQRLYLSLGFRREPRLDWSPAAGVVLHGFRLTL